MNDQTTYFTPGQSPADLQAAHGARFAEWLAAWGKPGLSVSACADDAFWTLAERLAAGESPTWELRSALTLSGAPAHFSI